MVKYTILFLLVNVAVGYAQVSEKLEKILIDNEKYLGYNALHPKMIELEETIDKEATTEELYFLSCQGNINRRLFAIKALVRRGDPKTINVFEQSLISGERVVQESPSFGRDASLSSFIYEQVYQYIWFDLPLREFYLQSIEEMFDLILKHRSNDIELLEELANCIPVKEKYYKAIREHVVNNKSDKLLVHIAKYKKEQDLSLIKSFGKNAFGAVEEFPHEDLLEILEMHIEENEKYPYMFALSKFCSQRAYDVVKEVIKYNVAKLDKECGNLCLDAIYNQVEKEKCTLYYPLLEELWVTHKIISVGILNNYKFTHSKEQSAGFLLKGFLLDEEPLIIQNNIYDLEALLDSDMSTKEDNIAFVLSELKNLSPNKYVDALRHNIKYVWIGELERFLIHLHDPEALNYIKDILLERLNFPQDIYDLLYITDAAKTLKDDELYQYGLKVIRRNRNKFKEQDYLEEEYQEFILKHNLKN